MYHQHMAVPITALLQFKSGNLVGLDLPDSYGTWTEVGVGDNPGQLGQEYDIATKM
jgi:hypothetical protein